MLFDPRTDPPEREAEGWERWTLTIVMALFFGMIGADLLMDYEPRKLGAIFVPLFWIPLVILHEAGHALVARLCGWEVERVVIGFGRLMRRSRLFGIDIEWRQFPISGYVLPYPANLRSPRLKNTLIYAGGPGVEALLVLGIALAVGGETLITRTDSVPMIAAQSLCISAMGGLIFTIVPHTTTSGGGKSWSDGMGILMSWRLPDSYFERMRVRPNSTG